MQELRQSLINTITNKSFDELWKMIDGASSLSSDTSLPGLGIIFEIWWKNAPLNKKQALINDLTKYLN